MTEEQKAPYLITFVILTILFLEPIVEAII